MSAGLDGEARIIFRTAPNGTIVKLVTFGPALATSVDAYEFIDFWVSIETVGLSATTLVRTIGGGTGP